MSDMKSKGHDDAIAFAAYCFALFMSVAIWKGTASTVIPVLPTWAADPPFWTTAAWLFSLRLLSVVLRGTKGARK